MKKRILFVDDEEKILDGLRRTLRNMRQEWDMEFALSGEDALDILKDENIDVIVSDMRMPGMNGLELLGEVKRLYPEVVRIILSGYSDQDMIIKSIELTHRYLSKPCNIELLKSIINSSFELRNLLKQEKLRKLISQITTIPSLPALYQRLLGELTGPHVSIENVSNIIAGDIGMSARMLQIVNSSYFGYEKKINNVEDAVKTLGLETIKSLVLSIDIFSKFEKGLIEEFSIEDLLDHSIITSNYAKEISIVEKAHDKELINNSCIAGMLHDIGILIIATNLTEKFKDIIEVAKKDNISLYEAEKDVLGTSHAELGGYLTKLWGFPDGIVNAIAFHHRPQESPEKTFSSLTCVHAANCFFYERYPEKNRLMFWSVDKEYFEKIGLPNNFSLWKEKCFNLTEKR